MAITQATPGAADTTTRNLAEGPILGIPPAQDQGKVITSESGIAPATSSTSPLPFLRIVGAYPARPGCDHRDLGMVGPQKEISVTSSAEIHFCPRCGQPIHHQLKFGKERPVCLSCGWIYFSDPKVAVVAVIVQEGKLLLARRVNEPHRGKWTLPGGFMDAMEDPLDAVQRECRRRDRAGRAGG